MNNAQGFGLNESARRPYAADEPRPRAVGSPLPVGKSGRTAPPPADEEDLKSAPPPGRALTNSTAPHQGNGLDRAMTALRMAIPFVQKILPLLDGNIGTAVANILNQSPHPPQTHVTVNLEPIEESLTDLRSQHRDLRLQMGEQNSSLKRVEDQLEMVREATDRNTLEQQELLEDLKAVGNKVNVFAVFALALLAASILLNVLLYLHIRRVLP